VRYPGRCPRRGGRRSGGAVRSVASAQLVAAVRRITEVLERVLDPETAGWATLVGLTAGQGLGFNRAFILRVQGERLEGWLGVGPRTREEGAALWHELRENGVNPISTLERPDPAVVAAEQRRLAPLLRALSCPLDETSSRWHRPLVARRGHPLAAVRRWLAQLGSHSLAVIPVIGAGELWGVVLADNFITHRPILPAVLEAASTLVQALRTAVERIELLQRLSEEERRRISAEHAAAMLETARTLAHDLKNPLTVAGGLASEVAAVVGEQGGEFSPQLAAIVDAIRHAEARLAELVAGLASRATGTPLSAVDVTATVERVLSTFRPLAARRGIRFEVENQLAGELAAAVPSYLERCIENLVGNAIEALERAQVGDGCVRLALSADRTTVRVDVADNGPPLPPTMQTDPFSGGVTTREGGGGLGLASVRRLTDAMEGRVEYDESMAGWVRFSICLRRWV
jgi:signal transduction histidine kinase